MCINTYEVQCTYSGSSTLLKQWSVKVKAACNNEKCTDDRYTDTRTSEKWVAFWTSLVAYKIMINGIF